MKSTLCNLIILIKICAIFAQFHNDDSGDIKNMLSTVLNRNDNVQHRKNNIDKKNNESNIIYLKGNSNIGNTRRFNLPINSVKDAKGHMNEHTEHTDMDLTVSEEMIMEVDESSNEANKINPINLKQSLIPRQDVKKRVQSTKKDRRNGLKAQKAINTYFPKAHDVQNILHEYPEFVNGQNELNSSLDNFVKKMFTLPVPEGNEYPYEPFKRDTNILEKTGQSFLDDEEVEQKPVVMTTNAPRNNDPVGSYSSPVNTVYDLKLPPLFPNMWTNFMLNVANPYNKFKDNFGRPFVFLPPSNFAASPPNVLRTFTHHTGKMCCNKFNEDSLTG